MFQHAPETWFPNFSWWYNLGKAVHSEINKFQYNKLSFFPKFQLISEIWQICLISLPLKKTKCMDPKWSPIPELDWSWLLNFSNLPIHSHCLHFWIMLEFRKNANVRNRSTIWNVPQFLDLTLNVEKWKYEFTYSVNKSIATLSTTSAESGPTKVKFVKLYCFNKLWRIRKSWPIRLPLRVTNPGLCLNKFGSEILKHIFMKLRGFNFCSKINRLHVHFTNGQDLEILKYWVGHFLPSQTFTTFIRRTN